MDNYDGIINKPKMEEILYHAGFHKYIDKYLGKNGKWIYKYKSKVQEFGAKTKRKLKGIDPETPTKYGLTIGDDNGKANSHSGKVNLIYQNPKDRKARFDAGIAAGRKRVKKKAIIDKFTKRQLQKAFPSGGKNAGYGKEYVTSFRTKTSKSRKDPFGFGGDQYDAKYLRNPRAGSTRGQGYSSSIGSADNNKATAKALRNREAAKRSKKNRKSK